MISLCVIHHNYYKNNGTKTMKNKIKQLSLATLSMGLLGALLLGAISPAPTYAATQTTTVPLIPVAGGAPGTDLELMPGFNISMLADLTTPNSATQAATISYAPGTTDPSGNFSTWSIDTSGVCGGVPVSIQSIKLVTNTVIDNEDPQTQGVVLLVSDSTGALVSHSTVTSGEDTTTLGGFSSGVFRGINSAGGSFSPSGTIDATWPYATGSLIHIWHSLDSIPVPQGLTMDTTITSALVTYEDGSNGACASGASNEPQDVNLLASSSSSVDTLASTGDDATLILAASILLITATTIILNKRRV